MKRGVIVYFVIIFSRPVVVFCENNRLQNEQGIIILNEATNGGDTEGGSMLEQNNFQDQILSNPETNAAARTGIQQGGGNTAIINQNGHRNSSSVIQSGDNNMAVQSQSGNDNELYLKQKGSNNSHHESQTGSHNRKVIIQNDSEAIIEQVTQ
ncbi:MAG: hypothetical protein HGB06_05305 [Chlorobaculum sp.]|jgi:hypothetical protein|nr:hypothetical protein [Chlorobaculum sp.]